MKFRWLAGACAALLIGNAAAQSPDKGALGQAPVWDRLERFRGEREFLDYLRAVRRAARAHGYDWAAGGGVQYAQSEEPALCSDGTPPPCKSEEYEVLQHDQELADLLDDIALIDPVWSAHW